MRGAFYIVFIVIIDMLCIVDGARAGPDGPKEAAFVCHIGVSGSKHQSPQSVTRYPKAILMLLSTATTRAVNYTKVVQFAQTP